VSISVNVWCDAEEQDLYKQKILTHVLPFEPDWDVYARFVLFKKVCIVY
jgi:hypothetical protein